MELSGFGIAMACPTYLAILINVNKRASAISELVQETRLPRRTVISAVRRLFEREVLKRERCGRGFRYEINERFKFDLTESGFQILRELLRRNREIMVPSACRIVTVLIERKSAFVRLFFEKGWSETAIRRGVKRLFEKGIVARNSQDDSVELALEVLNVGMPFDVTKELMVASMNFNDYENDERKEGKIDLFKPMLKTADLWAIQEFKVGKNLKWVREIAQKRYEVILPKSYNESKDNNLSVLLLIDKVKYASFQHLCMNVDAQFDLRYVYGVLTTRNNRRIRIMNLHIPPTFESSEERKIAINRFRDAVITEIRKCRMLCEEFILLGDLNAHDYSATESDNFTFISRLSDIMIDVHKPYFGENSDWRFTHESVVKRRLDYIFVNDKISYDNLVVPDVENTSLIQKISDHKIIRLQLKSKPA